MIRSHLMVVWWHLNLFTDADIYAATVDGKTARKLAKEIIIGKYEGRTSTARNILKVFQEHMGPVYIPFDDIDTFFPYSFLTLF